MAMAHTMRDFGVDLLQGYHFGHAMSPEDFERYLVGHFKAG
jgi:EAL domain-containing protein (putative c-di-GMP-specific phosphodiesterase class I)